MNGLQESVREVFRALTVESLAKVSGERLALAAVTALSKAGVDATLPPDVRSDVGVAERFLCEHVASLPDPYPVLQRLLWVTDDPHTVLLTKQGAASLMGLIAGGRSTDPGVCFGQLGDGRLVVTEVVPGGAAALSGMMPGDVVCAVVGEQPRRGLEAVGGMLGLPEGSRFPIEVERAGQRHRLTLHVVTGLLPLLVRRLVEPSLGYIRLRWITASQDPDRDTATLLRRALDDLAREGARGIVLDLRGNQGGYGITRVASVLTDGDPIVIYRHPSGDEEVASRNGERSAVRLPLAVLVDGETNSAAEMIALALQEHGDARIVGRPTAGGLNVPLRKPIGSEHVLMVPGTHVLGPRTRTPNAGMRVMPDVLTTSRTIDDLVGSRDPELDVARQELGLRV